MLKSADYYRALPYTRRVRLERDESGDECFVAWIEELDGVMVDGGSPIEAKLLLQEASGKVHWGRTDSRTKKGI